MPKDDHAPGLTERRKYRRFKVPRETYAVFRAPHPMLCQIIDISEGGFSILYIEGDRKPTNVSEFDLFTLDNDVKVKAIAAVARSDQVMPGIGAHDSETRRRRGIEFVGLLDGQKKEVRKIIMQQSGGDGNGRRDS